MIVIEGGDDLRISNHELIHHEVGNQRPYQELLVVNEVLSLLLDIMPSFPQFDHQGVLVQPFI